MYIDGPAGITGIYQAMGTPEGISNELYQKLFRSQWIVPYDMYIIARTIPNVLQGKNH